MPSPTSPRFAAPVVVALAVMLSISGCTSPATTGGAERTEIGATSPEPSVQESPPEEAVAGAISHATCDLDLTDDDVAFRIAPLVAPYVPVLEHQVFVDTPISGFDRHYSFIDAYMDEGTGVSLSISPTGSSPGLTSAQGADFLAQGMSEASVRGITYTATPVDLDGWGYAMQFTGDDGVINSRMYLATSTDLEILLSFREELVSSGTKVVNPVEAAAVAAAIIDEIC